MMWCSSNSTAAKVSKVASRHGKKLRNDWFILLTTCAALTLLPCPLLGISLQSSIPHMYRRWSSLLRNMALIDVIQAACSLHPAITWSSPNLSKEFMGEADLRAAFSAHCKTSSFLSETGSHMFPPFSDWTCGANTRYDTGQYGMSCKHVGVPKGFPTPELNCSSWRGEVLGTLDWREPREWKKTSRCAYSCYTSLFKTFMGVSENGGTQQPWVFLLKMIILGCLGGTTI